MKTFSNCLLSLATAATFGLAAQSTLAADYEIDPAHSFVQFRIQHLGYSWLIGRFNNLSGQFSYDPSDPGGSKISVEIDTTSVDTNHAERDKHLRSDDFLHVDNHPQATFVSTNYSGDADEGTLEGDLTVRDVTKPISFNVKKIGEGDDPWGGYRAGFEGSVELTRKDFGIEYDLGPASKSMTIELFIEGIRK